MKPIQLLLIIFCLGIFLIPKDDFYAQVSQENCCKTESKNKSCCGKEKENHHSSDSKKEHQSCKDDCCSTCATCHTFVENSFAKSNFWEIPTFSTIQKIQFQYADPFISNSLEEIWQPPKLG
ncbi:hypothetical protein ASG31_01585 [Chryseobacterium sp. Leaf404]|uniref:hypothetical protein n=1 Tax=unclassified Chryseobacterium TaxID=2593645 RepID=UPI0007005C40|nr:MULTISPECIES: hypothetical protein [unclassified Chryseobacterium]KQT22059.1 hypothetical protein ASG31_01585 [Chryseobacterium sp. Leaf404]